MRFIFGFTSIFLITIVSIKAQEKCTTLPMKIEKGADGTANKYCEYVESGGTRSLQLLEGSEFITKTCQKCTCSASGLRCCDRRKPPLNIPDGCKLILDGCNHLLVTASDYNVECLTGKRVSNGGKEDPNAIPVNKLNALLEKVIGLMGSNRQIGGQQTSIFGIKPQNRMSSKSSMSMMPPGMKSPTAMIPPGMMGMMPFGTMGMGGPAMFGRRSRNSFNPSKFLNPEYEPTAMDFYHLMSSSSGGESQTATSPYAMNSPSAMGGFSGASSMGGGMPGTNPGMISEVLEAAGMSGGGGLIDTLIMSELLSGGRMDAGTTRKPTTVLPKITKPKPSTIPPPVIIKTTNAPISPNALTSESKSTNALVKDKSKPPFPLFTGKDLADMMLLKQLLTAKRTEKSKKASRKENIFANNKAAGVRGQSTETSTVKTDNIAVQTDNIVTIKETGVSPKETQSIGMVEPTTTVIPMDSSTLPSVPLQDEPPMRVNSVQTSLLQTETTNIATSILPEVGKTVAVSTVNETPISAAVISTNDIMNLLNSASTNAEAIKATQVLETSSVNASPSEATKVEKTASTDVATGVEPAVMDYAVTNNVGTVTVAQKETTQVPTIGTTDFGTVSNAEAALLDLAFGGVSSGSAGLLDTTVSTDPVSNVNSQWSNLIHVVPQQGTTDNSLFAVTTTQASPFI